MLKILLKSKILISVIVVSLLIISTLFVYIPKVTEQNTIDTVVRNSENTVAQIKLTRAYYVDSVVKDVKKFAPQLTFDYDHHGPNGKLPFPTSTIHDLSKIYSDNTGLTFNFFSEYPFKPKASRVLTPLQKEVIEYIKKDENTMWIKRDTIDGKPVLRVAVVDYMTDPSCVSCHNNHKDRTWDKGYWKLGDKRGILEVITPLDKDLAANETMRNKILIFIAGAMLLLVIYYSITLIRREKELKNENDILDSKVKIEVEKNRTKEKLLVQKSRTAAMGEMMAAIIHQWKQPLNGISIASSAIEMHILMDDFDKELLNKQTSNIATQIEYMNTTMNDFRDFFKEQPKSCYEIGSCVNEVLKLIGKVYETQYIKFEINLDEKIYVAGYPNELNQVIINIFNNARDIIIEKEPTVKTIFVKTYKEGDNGILSITDCAGGIPDDILPKVFDPYITTKTDDKGTGIGLDMSKSIIEKVDGSLTASNVITNVDGVDYKGAQFTIELLVCNEKQGKIV
ncbi:MAG: DUF3365 domain-containing protein [Campylobacterota bacterium]|nr:DUF3365 domain-containing protein [Campylobacterota bacterium]